LRIARKKFELKGHDMSVASLLVTTIAVHKATQRAKALYADRFAPDFNYCDFIDFDELKISQLIAWLLNPKASHGQRGLFLHLFARRLRLDWTVKECEEAEVRVEAPAYGERKRRIDILIKGKGLAIGVENKLMGAGDQKDQVADYLSYLKTASSKEAPPCLIYLTRTGEKPSDYSISADKVDQFLHESQLHLWGFSHRTAVENNGRPTVLNYIFDWLADCRNASKAERISVFINELLRALTTHIEGISDMTEHNQIIEEATKSPETVLAALHIINASSDIKLTLIAQLRAALEASCEKCGWLLTGNITKEKWSGFNLDLGKNYPCLFRFAFERPNFNELLYGLIRRNDNDKGDKSVRERISIHLGAPDGNSDRYFGPWDWYRQTTTNDPRLPVTTDWSLSPEPWVAIANGSLSDKIVEAAQLFKDLLDEERITVS
jgi:hypothetical protein